MYYIIIQIILIMYIYSSDTFTYKCEKIQYKHTAEKLRVVSFAQGSSSWFLESLDLDLYSSIEIYLLPLPKVLLPSIAQITQINSSLNIYYHDGSCLEHTVSHMAEVLKLSAARDPFQ